MSNGRVMWWQPLGWLFDEVEAAYRAGLNGETGYPWDAQLNVPCDLRELRRLGCSISELEEAALRRQYEDINAAYRAGCRARAREGAAA